MRDKIALIIGAGPAGLSAAYHLLTETTDIKPIVIELENTVGGLAKSFYFGKNGLDLGPHRFFTKDEKVFNFWKSILPVQGYLSKDDLSLNRDIEVSQNGPNPETDNLVFLKRRRFSRIYYLRKFFDYPIKINVKTILNLGLSKTFVCGISYLKSKAFKRNELTLEDFMINRFGVELYKTFFENYTQKVWGRHPKDISKEWGEQRIKGLSLTKAILGALKFKTNETSLIENYYYPKWGAGQMWNAIADQIKMLGGEIHLNSKVLGLNLENNKISSITVNNNGEIYDYTGDFIISSMPIKELISTMQNVPQNIKEIAKDLPYRDYQLITFLLNNFDLKNNIKDTKWKTVNNICPDSWIYVQENDVTVGRLYISNNCSPYMVEDEKILIGMEYFCNEGDNLWNMSDDEIKEFAQNELIKIGAIKENYVIETNRIKVKKAYPAYFDSYKDFNKIKDFINSIDNLNCIGRNGQHKYNNMDHSVLSGIVAVDIIKNKSDKKDLWNVNTEKAYHETK